MKREDVFIANILKSRPPGSRDPQPEEIEACWPYLERQIQLIEPRVIATLGNFATKRSPAARSASRARGTPQVHELASRTVFVFPLLHPAAALRTPPWRRPARGLRQAAGPPGGTAARPRAAGAGRGRARRGAPGSGSTSSVERRRDQSAAETEAFGARLAAGLGPGDVILVSGELGSGKTTLIRGACRALGVEGESSPRPSRSAGASRAGSIRTRPVPGR